MEHRRISWRQTATRRRRTSEPAGHCTCSALFFFFVSKLVSRQRSLLFTLLAGRVVVFLTALSFAHQTIAGWQLVVCGGWPLIANWPPEQRKKKKLLSGQRRVVQLGAQLHTIPADRSTTTPLGLPLSRLCVCVPHRRVCLTGGRGTALRLAASSGAASEAPNWNWNWSSAALWPHSSRALVCGESVAFIGICIVKLEKKRERKFKLPNGDLRPGQKCARRLSGARRPHSRGAQAQQAKERRFLRLLANLEIAPNLARANF